MCYVELISVYTSSWVQYSTITLINYLQCDDVGDRLIPHGYAYLRHDEHPLNDVRSNGGTLLNYTLIELLTVNLRSCVHISVTIRDSMVVVRHRTETENRDPLPTSTYTHMGIYVRWYIRWFLIGNFS